LNHALLKEQQGEGNEISENEEDILKLILEKFTEAANSEDQLTRDVARLGDAVTLFDATLELDVINTADIERVKTYLSEAQTAIQQAEEETNDILSILDGTNDITENIKPLVTIAEGFIDVQETLRQAHAALEQKL